MELKYEEITISKDEYNKLKEDSAKLNALLNAGVDNWVGYSEALPSRSNCEGDESYKDIYGTN